MVRPNSTCTNYTMPVKLNHLLHVPLINLYLFNMYVICHTFHVGQVKQIQKGFILP